MRSVAVMAFTDARKALLGLERAVCVRMFERREFNQPFFIILNVAVGGNFPGAPSSSTTFPQTRKLDWVRVY